MAKLANTKESRELSKNLKKRGWSFVINSASAMTS